MKELKIEHYGAWVIRIRVVGDSSSGISRYYQYKIELHDTDISGGWISAPYGCKKACTLAYALRAIDTNYKKTVLISEHGAVLRWKDDQFRGGHFG